MGFMPVQLDHELARDPPAAQVGAYPERDHEQRRIRSVGKHVDRGHIEVVVVIVGDQHDIDARKVGQRDRHRMAAAWSDRRRGRDPVAPHRVRKHAHTLYLEQHGGVAQPGGRKVGRRLGKLRALEGHRRSRSAPTSLGDELRGDRGTSTAFDHGCRQPVVEEPVAPLWGVAHVPVGSGSAERTAYSSSGSCDSAAEGGHCGKCGENRQARTGHASSVPDHG